VEQALMASWQETAPLAPARPRPRPQARPAPKPRTAAKRRPRRRAGVAGGLVWIVVAGVLLAGIVALNVAVLRLNVQLDRLNNDRQQLQAGNAALASKLSSVSSSLRIQTLARNSGFVPAESPTFVDIGPRAR
jgi:hypothetical protein